MKKIYTTKEEFLSEPDNIIRRKIKRVLNNWYDNKKGRKILHDSDIEDLKYALEEIGIDITWKALYDFLGAYDE